MELQQPGLRAIEGQELIMHSMQYDAKMPGVWVITINHNPDWDGEAIISWTDAERPKSELFPSQNDVDATMRWFRQHQHECRVDARELLRGRAQPMPCDQGGISTVTVPFMVLTIATWLAVNNWWQRKLVNLTEDAYAGGYK